MSSEKFQQTLEELIARFGAVSFSPHPIQGVWAHEGVRYEDLNRRITIDVEDTPENVQFVREFKQILLERFEQLEIYIRSFPVEII